MYTKFFSWLSLLGLVSLLTLEAAAQGAAVGAKPATLTSPHAGRIIAKNVTGTVTYNIKASPAPAFALVEDGIIQQGSIVHTGPNSSVVLLFENGASIRLADTSDLDIGQFMLDPVPEQYDRRGATEEPSFSNTEITLTRGELIGNVRKLKKAGTNESKFRVSTPVGAAGIRGTTFKIVYRPVGTGQTTLYNFVMTTVEGNVEVVVGTGTVTGPPVSVTQNKEVVINNVEVNATTGAVTATLANGTTTSVTVTPPPVGDAPPTTVQQVTVVAQQLVQQIANAVFTPPPTNNTPPPTDNTNKDEKKDEKKDTGTPGTTTSGQNLTPGH